MCKLIVTNPTCEIPNFTSKPWDEAILITPRNSVCGTWNRVAICKHCARTGNILYIFDTKDTIGDAREPLNMEQR